MLMIATVMLRRPKHNSIIVVDTVGVSIREGTLFMV